VKLKSKRVSKVSGPEISLDAPRNNTDTNRNADLSQRIGTLPRSSFSSVTYAHTQASLLFTPFLKDKVITEEWNQLDATYYFIVFLIGSTCFGHHYATKARLSSCFSLQPGHYSSLTAPNLQPTAKTKNETTNVVNNIIVASSWWLA